VAHGQILSAFSQEEAEDELHRFLKIPQFMKSAFACRLGHPGTASAG